MCVAQAVIIFPTDPTIWLFQLSVMQNVTILFWSTGIFPNEFEKRTRIRLRITTATRIRVIGLGTPVPGCRILFSGVRALSAPPPELDAGGRAD